MSELAQAMRIFGNMGLHVHKCPSGKWGFVGNVPASLYYVKNDGTDATEEDLREVKASSFPAMTCKARGLKIRLFDTEQEAMDAAAKAVQS